MKHDDVARTADEWSSIVNPLDTAKAQIRALAEQGNVAAKAIVKIDDALKAKKHAERWGEDVPAWARETLAFLDEYQNGETQNLDEAIAAIRTALR